MIHYKINRILFLTIYGGQRVLWGILNRSPKSEGGPMINLDHWPGETRGSGHINPSRVNQDLFYINPSLSLEAAAHFLFCPKFTKNAVSIES